MPLSNAGTNALRNTFNGCSALEEVDFRGATSVPALSNVNCFENTNEDFVIYVPENLSAEWVATVNWSTQDVVKHIYGYNPPSGGIGLTFTAEQANSTVAMVHGYSAPTLYLEYSTDDGNSWYSFVPGTTVITLANVGDKAMIRATSNGNATVSDSSSLSHNNYFSLTGKLAASESVLYLLSQDGVYDSALPSYCFSHLFRGCSQLTQAPELPSTLLGNYCYEGMFYACSFTEGPYLPSTTLAPYCYYWMFEGCNYMTSIKISYTGNFSGSDVPTNAFVCWM